MSNSSWKKLLSQKLKPPAGRNNLRLAIIGIGAELNGDDAVGILVTQKLLRVITTVQDVLILDGGTLPENYSNRLRQFQPELSVFIDAADFGGVPGEINLISPEQVSGSSFSTHSMPLSMVLSFLSKEIKSEIIILGVQPLSVEFGDPLSPACKKAVAKITREFSKFLNTDSRSEK